LKAEEMQGGTFTVSNLGGFDIDAFTPIINYPECAILGIGRIRRMPVVREEHIVVGDQITLSLTFDHRIVDGAPAARFLQALVRMIQDPAAFLPAMSR
jgi:pyruvate dehydrogenase E2 component (dihydrolipoamide acetyltransferase)